MQMQPNVYVVVQKPAEVMVTTPAQHTGGIITQGGTVVTALPEGTTVITINNKRYYKVNNTYYEKLTSENGHRFKSG